jgi:hypothetical protein
MIGRSSGRLRVKLKHFGTMLSAAPSTKSRHQVLLLYQQARWQFPRHHSWQSQVGKEAPSGRQDRKGTSAHLEGHTKQSAARNQVVLADELGNW